MSFIEEGQDNLIIPSRFLPSYIDDFIPYKFYVRAENFPMVNYKKGVYIEIILTILLAFYPSLTNLALS